MCIRDRAYTTPRSNSGSRLATNDGSMQLRPHPPINTPIRSHGRGRSTWMPGRSLLRKARSYAASGDPVVAADRRPISAEKLPNVTQTPAREWGIRRREWGVHTAGGALSAAQRQFNAAVHGDPLQRADM
eukprot:206155-Prorocentrum_minimum.AAC.1